MKHRNSPYTFGHQLKREIIITGRSMSIIKVSEYMQRELTDFELPPLGLNWGLVQMGVDPWTFPTDDHPFFLPPVSGNQSGTLSIHHSVGRAEWKWVGWVNSDLIDEQWRSKTNSVKCGYHLSENEDDWTWEIQKLFCEKSNAAPKEALKSIVCKCRDSWVWQMQNGQTSKSRHLQCANTYVWFWQIHEGLPYWWQMHIC